MESKKFYKAFVDSSYDNEFEEVVYGTKEDAYDVVEDALYNVVFYGAEELTDEELLKMVDYGRADREEVFKMIIENGLEEEYPKTFAYLLEEIH